MKIFHYLKKFKLHIEKEGLKNTIQEMIFFNRVMVVIEKEISFTDYDKDSDFNFIILDKNNYAQYSKHTNIIKYVKHFCKNGATCLIAFRGDTLLGYQLWTHDNNFKDLKQIDIQLGADEMYLFDLYVLPEYRGTTIPKHLTYEVFNYLISTGVNKIYGFYFGDNIKALWWHRAFLKCREIKKKKLHRMLCIEFVDGRPYFMLL